jgi:putative transposase
LHPEFGLQAICYVFGKSRQAYYKYLKEDKKQLYQEAIIVKMIAEIRLQMPRIGGRKLFYLLKEPLQKNNIEIGRDKLFDIMAGYGLRIRRRKRRKVITTDSNHPFKKYPNLIKTLTVMLPNQLWVSDITYIPLAGKYCYLSLITDGYSRKVMGYCLYPTLEKEGPIAALKMALATLNPKHETLIHHSDRGLQYCSKEYTDLLGGNKITISMTERGDPYENAIAERVNGILKTEFGLDKAFRNLEEAKQEVDNTIKIYNEQRPHSSCNYLTPGQAHLQKGALQKRWKQQHESSIQ